MLRAFRVLSWGLRAGGHAFDVRVPVAEWFKMLLFLGVPKP